MSSAFSSRMSFLYGSAAQAGATIRKELKTEELALEYAEWMRERWNHPSVVDLGREQRDNNAPDGARHRAGARHGPVAPAVGQQLQPPRPEATRSNRIRTISGPEIQAADLATADPVPQGNAITNDGRHPVIINEYGWLWLNRDGTPTTLTRDLYENLLGSTATTQQRRSFMPYPAAETEFWRCHRKAAAVMHFTTLGYSRPDGQTSDHWLDVGRLTWEPEFLSLCPRRLRAGRPDDRRLGGRLSRR